MDYRFDQRLREPSAFRVEIYELSNVIEKRSPAMASGATVRFDPLAAVGLRPPDIRSVLYTVTLKQILPEIEPLSGKIIPDLTEMPFATVFRWKDST